MASASKSDVNIRLALLLAGLVLAGCLEPAERSSLTLVVRGPAYPRPRCAKGAAAQGKLHPLGDPVPGARVTLTPGDHVGTTDADGRLTLEEIPEGSYRLAVSAAAFAPLDKELDVTVKASGGNEVSVSLDPCVFGGGNQLRMGFGKKIALTGFSFCEGEWKDAAYTWTQLEGPDVRDTVSDWNRQVLTFTTREIEEVRRLPDQPQILSFSPDQAGEYVFQVVATTRGGLVSKDYVLVTSTSVTGGMNSVPPYDRYYFVGEKEGPWSWKITKWPEGWPRTLEGADTRTPSVRVLPDRPLERQETLVIHDDVSGISFSLVVGTWDMVNRDCGRTDCHPALQKSWEGTRHASTWRRMLDGELVSARAPPAERCAACHSLGYDRSISNGGYDDIADLYDVAFPTRQEAGSYARLPTPLKDVSNVFCVGCHGPARVDPPVAEQPGRFEVGVCARCHDRLPEQDLVAQWRQSRMAQTIKGDLNGPESRSDCAGCHTAQGFYYDNFALGRPPNENVVVMSCCENLAPITCQTCHSPMYARNKAQVFAYDSVETESGLKLSKVGSGAVCVMCHNTEHDVTAASTLSKRLAPHSPQADLSYGRGGFLLGPADYPVPSGVTCSKNAGDGCATCHMDEGPPVGDPGHRKVGDHTFRMISSEGQPNTRPCQACHPGRESFDPRARHDYDGDARTESVREEVDGLMALLRAQLAAAVAARAYRGCDPARSPGAFVKRGFAQRIVVTDALGFDLGDCDRNGIIEREEEAFVFPQADLLLHKAAYNYLFVASDKSRGLHNLPYVVSLLQRTIHAVAGGKNLPDWDLFQAAKP
jgi:hypothetical protein